MSAQNFWDNFSHGFMQVMFDNNPFFGCWGGFPPLWGGCGPVWGRPWMFGGCNPCFNPWRLNSSVFLTPNVMSGNFYQLMPDINPPAFNMSIDMSKLFPTDNIWDSYNKQNIYMQILCPCTFILSFRGATPEIVSSRLMISWKEGGWTDGNNGTRPMPGHQSHQDVQD